MKKTVYLVNVGNPTRWIAVPFGLAFIAKALIHHDINVEIIDLLPVEPERRREVLERRLAEIGGGAIFGFGMILGNGNVAVTMEFADLVKQASPDNVLVFGGPAATAMPKSIFEHSRADYIVLGEGEERFRLLVEALFEGEREPLIEGVLTRERPEPTKVYRATTAPRVPKLKDLNVYSPPAYDLLDMKFYTGYLEESGRCFDVVASRGCWANCSFCFRFVGAGYHGRGADSILDEIEFVQSRWGISDFAFTDENFFQNRRTFFELMNRAGQRGLDFRFRCMTRVDNVDPEITEVLSDRNCLGVSFGVESASNERLAEVAKKTRIEDIAEKVRLLQEAGIEARGSFILGFPNDTEQDFQTTYEFIAEHGLAGHCTVNYLTPLPATRLFAEYRQRCAPRGDWEYFMRVDAASLYRELVVNLTDLPDDVLMGWREKIRALGQTEVVTPQGFSSFLKDRE